MSGGAVFTGALCVQRGTPMFFGYLPASLIVQRARVDVYDPATGQGYQRALTQGRTRRVADYYSGGGLLANPLMLNIRDHDMADVRIGIDEEAAASLAAAKQDRSSWTGAGTLTIGHQVPLWIYDGQHRQAALTELARTMAESFNHFPVPAAVTLGLDPTAEAREFYEVNTNAMAVQTDLAWTLLASLAAADTGERARLADRGREWLIDGEQVTSELELLRGPWQDRFLLVNSRKQKNDGKLVRRAAFIRSLRPVVEFPLLRNARAADVAAVVNAYWLGITRVLPRAFADPDRYVIQKGAGITTFHSLLPDVIEVIRSRDGRIRDPEAFSSVLSGLRQLIGYAVVDGTHRQVTGVKFWEAGSAAATFSGNAGKRRLLALVKAVLPAPEGKRYL